MTMGTIAALLILFSFMALNSNAQEITRWRTENASGCYYSDKVLPSWPADGPQNICKEVIQEIR